MPSEAERVIERLKDISDNIDAARAFVAGKTLDQFNADQMLNYAVVRALEIVSEATRHLPDDIKARHPHIAWQAIQSSGNVFRHGYKAVTLEVVWDTVQRDLAPLKAAVLAELERLGGG